MVSLARLLNEINKRSRKLLEHVPNLTMASLCLCAWSAVLRDQAELDGYFGLFLFEELRLAVATFDIF